MRHNIPTKQLFTAYTVSIYISLPSLSNKYLTVLLASRYL